MIAYSPASTFCLTAERYVPQYSVSVDEIVLEAGSITPAVAKDANISIQDSATVVYNADIQYRVGDPVIFESLTPSIGEVDQEGYVTRVTNGAAKIKVTNGPDLTVVEAPVSLSDSADVISFASWRSGSLAKFANDRVNTLITGVSPDISTRSLFSGQNRNPSMFCAAYAQGLTSVAYAVNGSSYMGFTAITTRHVVACGHIGDYSGLQISFITTGNVRLNRTLLKAYFVPGVDIAVYLLDSVLPSTITPMRLPPTNVALYLPQAYYPLPFLFFDRDQQANVGRSTRLDSTTVGVSVFDDSRSGFYTLPNIGTSGKPIIIPYGSGATSLAILGVFTYAGSGPTLHSLTWTSIIPALDASAGVSTGLQPTRASLAAFTSYP